MLVLVLLAISAVPALAAPKDINSILDVAKAVNEATGEFSILLLAIDAADPAVEMTLDGKGQYTVFAPTDAAFVALLEELDISAEDLLGDQELVTAVLLYHVAHGRRAADDIVSSDRIRTLNRGFLFQDGGVLTDNNGRQATIVVPDAAFADNGVIHIIDRVVLP
jgi:uncharacterized surface protein with fasciclin (FAS1) repeats